MSYESMTKLNSLLYVFPLASFAFNFETTIMPIYATFENRNASVIGKTNYTACKVVVLLAFLFYFAILIPSITVHNLRFRDT